MRRFSCCSVSDWVAMVSLSLYSTYRETTCTQTYMNDNFNGTTLSSIIYLYFLKKISNKSSQKVMKIKSTQQEMRKAFKNI